MYKCVCILYIHVCACVYVSRGWRSFSDHLGEQWPFYFSRTFDSVSHQAHMHSRRGNADSEGSTSTCTHSFTKSSGVSIGGQFSLILDTRVRVFMCVIVGFCGVSQVIWLSALDSEECSGGGWLHFFNWRGLGKGNKTRATPRNNQLSLLLH